ncbi:mannose-1-phosphate guanylyltransferase [Terriglobus albidus]|uniref:mannose-1-phosphate guanylyltransferase n=1 Tax=Terriglobus albidus TaxID=1592106 RepID=UPI0021DFD055|nr:mannose-1-phosphate guanylyltransferase [Terriglobus albidus]
MSSNIANFIPVILAGGSGTRFWPRSRKSRAKQVLALDGERTMIQQTVDRLALITERKNIHVITNPMLAEQIRTQLPDVPTQHIISEPAARNTAPACGLAAFLIEREDPETVIGIFPADHVVRDADRFAAALQAGIAVAWAGDNIVVMGVPPTRPETGYGYIEQGDVALPTYGLPLPVRQVQRFTEKPDKRTASEFVATGRYAWNSGIFLWTARTLVNSLREHAPQIAAKLTEIASAFGSPHFEEVFARLYPECENISIDYAVLEPRSGKGERASGIFCIPAEFGWNDLGSWAALHEHRRSIAAPGCDLHGNVVDGSGLVSLNARGNYVYAKDLTVALVGVDGLVIVQTDDALLVTTLECSQDVGKVVKALQERGRREMI